MTLEKLRTDSKALLTLVPWSSEQVTSHGVKASAGSAVLATFFADDSARIFANVNDPEVNGFQWRHNTQHSDIQHNDTQHKGLICKITLSITFFCHYAECHVSFIGMLSVSMLSIIMLNVILLNVIILEPRHLA